MAESQYELRRRHHAALAVPEPLLDEDVVLAAAESLLKEEDVLPDVVMILTPRDELLALCAEIDDRLVQLALEVLKPRHFRAQ